MQAGLHLSSGWSETGHFLGNISLVRIAAGQWCRSNYTLGSQPSLDRSQQIQPTGLGPSSWTAHSGP